MNKKQIKNIFYPECESRNRPEVVISPKQRKPKGETRENKMDPVEITLMEENDDLSNNYAPS